MRVKEESENLAWNSTFRKWRHDIWSQRFVAKRRGKSWRGFIFLGSQITADSDCSHEIDCIMTVIASWKMFAPWKRSYDKPRQHIDKQRHHFADKVHKVKGYGFSSSHVCMWEVDHREGWALKIRCFQTGAGEDSRESLELQGDQTSLS